MPTTLTCAFCRGGFDIPPGHERAPALECPFCGSVVENPSASAAPAPTAQLPLGRAEKALTTRLPLGRAEEAPAIRLPLSRQGAPDDDDNDDAPPASRTALLPIARMRQAAQAARRGDSAPSSAGAAEVDAGSAPSIQVSGLESEYRKVEVRPAEKPRGPEGVDDDELVPEEDPQVALPPATALFPQGDDVPYPHGRAPRLPSSHAAQPPPPEQPPSYPAQDPQPYPSQTGLPQHAYPSQIPQPQHAYPPQTPQPQHAYPSQAPQPQQTHQGAYEAYGAQPQQTHQGAYEAYGAQASQSPYLQAHHQGQGQAPASQPPHAPQQAYPSYQTQQAQQAQQAAYHDQQASQRSLPYAQTTPGAYGQQAPQGSLAYAQAASGAYEPLASPRARPHAQAASGAQAPPYGQESATRPGAASPASRANANAQATRDAQDEPSLALDLDAPIRPVRNRAPVYLLLLLLLINGAFLIAGLGNNGIIHLGQLSETFGAAFGDEAPMQLRAPAPEPLPDPDISDLEAALSRPNIHIAVSTPMTVTLESGVALIVVEGRITNQSARPIEGATVIGEALDEDRVAESTPLTPLLPMIDLDPVEDEGLETIAEARRALAEVPRKDELGAWYSAMRQGASETLGPGETRAFLLVFRKSLALDERVYLFNVRLSESAPPNGS